MRNRILTALAAVATCAALASCGAPLPGGEATPVASAKTVDEAVVMLEPLGCEPYPTPPESVGVAMCVFPDRTAVGFIDRHGIDAAAWDDALAAMADEGARAVTTEDWVATIEGPENPATSVDQIAAALGAERVKAAGDQG